MSKFDARVALVTGATGGIGTALCKQFAEAGVSVAVTDLRQESCDELAEELRGVGVQAQGYVMDVCDTASVHKAVSQVLEDFGKIDILVNNAGVWLHPDYKENGFKPLHEMPEEDWLHIIDINLCGTIRVSQAVIPHMIKAGYGRIINLSSIAGISGLPGMADYAASKGGVILLTKTMAMELATKGITVNAVAPGMVARKNGETSPNAGTWVGRNCLPSEVARAIMFLADDDSGFITGVNFPVDGGRTIGPHGTGWKK